MGRGDCSISGGNYTLVAGDYAMCVTANNTVIAFTGTSQTNKQPVGWTSCAAQSNYFPLPTTLPFPCGNTTRTVTFNMWGIVVGGAP
jgi:hypothetical protein